MRRIIKNALIKLGYKNLLEGEDGVQGWALLEENPTIGMIITDWNMPEMNGLELVVKIRSDERFSHLPIIMVTTEGGKIEVIRALKAGVNNYIVKPFTLQVLEEKLATLL